MLPAGIRVRVVEDDLLRVRLPGRAAVVNPANTHGLMSGGVAGALRRAGGQAIEDEARSRAPIALGSALLTGAGTLPFVGVIHAPTMLHPGGDAQTDTVRQACRAAVKCAHGHRVEALALPGMGTGTGGLDARLAAEAMVRGLDEGLREAGAPPPAEVVLVAYDDRLHGAFQEALRAWAAAEAGTPPRGPPGAPRPSAE